MIRLLTKIWIALIPLLIYLLWVYVIEGIVLKKLLQTKKSKEKIIDGEFEIVGEKSTQSKSNKENDKSKIGNFSLHNKRFVATLYVSLIAMIISLVMSAFE